MNFSLNISLGNDDMKSPADVAGALRDVALRLDQGCAFSDPHTEGRITDRNGNLVGHAHFYIDDEKPATAPGLLQPQFWLIAQGTIGTPKLDIAIFERDKAHAIEAARRMVASLHAVGHYMFTLADETGSRVVATFKATQQPVAISVKEGEAQ